MKITTLNFKKEKEERKEFINFLKCTAMKQSSDMKKIAVAFFGVTTLLGFLADKAFGEKEYGEIKKKKINKTQDRQSNSKTVNDNITSLEQSNKLDKKELILSYFKDIILDIVKDKAKKYQTILYHREFFREFVKISSFDYFYDEKILEMIPRTEYDMESLLQVTNTLESVEKFLCNNRLRSEYKNIKKINVYI